jgi:hypothetical protein
MNGYGLLHISERAPYFSVQLFMYGTDEELQPHARELSVSRLPFPSCPIGS